MTNYRRITHLLLLLLITLAALLAHWFTVAAADDRVTTAPRIPPLNFGVAVAARAAEREQNSGVNRMLVADRPSLMTEGTTILTVNALTDATDAQPGNGICETAPGNHVCTLRAAVMETNARPGPDAILLPAGLYQLTIPGQQEDGAATGDLDILDPLIIQGASAESTIIDGGGLDRLFDIISNQVTVQIEGLTMRNGAAANDAGAALINRAQLYLTATTFSQHNGNSALQNKGLLIGQAVTLSFNETISALDNLGTATLENSQVYSNSGLGLGSDGTMTVISSTIADNGTGGVVGRQLTVEQSVVQNNGGPGIGSPGQVTLKQSKIISNSGAGVLVSAFADLTLIEDSLIDANRGFGIKANRLTLRHSTVSNNQESGVKVSGYFLSQIEQSVIHGNRAYDSGGGILSNSPLRIVDSTITDNSANNNGGGISSENDLLLIDTTISNNRTLTGDGGGIYQAEDAINLVNSTLSGNAAKGNGGGIASNAVVPKTSLQLGLYSSTIVSNTASGNAGGLYAPVAKVRMGNTILATNLTLTAGNIKNCSVQQPVDALGYNLLDDAGGCPLGGIVTGNQLGVNPRIGPLQANGGSTYTHLPLPGSPVIDAGNPSGCSSFDASLLFFDQRNYQRVVDGNQDGQERCDIGATEFGDVIPKSTYLPMISASSSSATLRQLPMASQVAETGSVVGVGLVISGVLLSALMTLFLIDQEETKEGAGKVEAVNASLGTDL